MAALWNDPRARQILLWAQRFFSQPYLDVDSVPAILDMSSGMQRFWRWSQILAGAVVVAVAGTSAYTLKVAPVEFDPIEAFCELAPSVGFLLMARLAVKRVRASFGQFDVTVEQGGKTWTAPIDSFLGLGWYYFTTITYSRESQIDRSFGYDLMANSVITTHHWIELAHPDPEKTLILAATMKDGGMAGKLQRYAKRLNRPIIADGVSVTIPTGRAKAAR